MQDILKLIRKNPSDFMSALQREKFIPKDKISTFKDICEKYDKELQKSENETENSISANVLKGFFENLGFDETSVQTSQEPNAGNSAIDLTLKKDGEVCVIVEAKKFNNKNEFFSGENAVCRALSETILYYFTERKKLNCCVKFIIITNFVEFYFFKSEDFENFFYKDKKINSFYEKLKDKKNSIMKKNSDFYEHIEKYLNNFFIEKDKFDENNEKSTPTLNAAYVNLRDINVNYEFMYKIFHRDFLFDEFNPNDANEIHEPFYRELLYILGLKESEKDGSKIIIQSDDKGSLYKATQKALKAKDKDCSFETVLKLIVLWLNRILFLKLIEANLMRFNQNDKNLKFLSIEKDTKHHITSFDDLNHLFFEIFAKNHKDRDKNAKFSHLPYLNSALFEKIELKDGLIDISELDENTQLEYFKDTSLLRQTHTKEKQKGSVRLINYIFEFLNAFDFGSGENQNDRENLINSSILGKVFEKLNGYKDGSIFTPNLITSYMCELSINKIVLDKFNTTKGWQCEDLPSLKIQLDKITNSKDDYKAINDIFNSLKICDPSVGSGHFLVSALNYLIKLKFELKILCDEHYERVKDISLRLENDELIIDDNQFAYQKPTKLNEEAHKIQRALFHAKKEIIENNLFGVDINDKSVEICKLRLWIELLKNSYYLQSGDENYDEKLDKDIHQMQTLPNIDINIKCGNSLISRFDIKSEFTSQDIQQKIKDYKNCVQDYKNPILKQFESKDKLQEKIERLKKFFATEFINDNLREQLNSVLKAHLKQFGSFSLENAELYAQEFDIEISNKNLNSEQEKQAYDSYGKIQALQKQINDILHNNRLENAFEWRFEFPEVLDEMGKFVGFDLLIGNPPYISNKGIEKGVMNEYERIFGLRDDLYNYFYLKAAKLAKNGGVISFITSNTFLTIQSKRSLRQFLQSKRLLELVNVGSVFKGVGVNAAIVSFINEDAKNYEFTYTDNAQNEEKVNKDNALKVSIEIYKSSPNEVFFTPNKLNLNLHNKLLKKANELKTQFWELIKDSKSITKNATKLDEYRQNLKFGDLTLLGLITDGGQGLATANNGKFIGVLEGTKEAKSVAEKRVDKLFNTKEIWADLSVNFTSKQDAFRHLNGKNENEIRAMFDEAKEKFGRDIFGQGFIYRIVNQNEAAILENLNDEEKQNGIDGDKCFVPYDKGDKDGNRWYLPTPYYIAWSKENVKFLKENSGKKGEGMPVVRNPQFYFKEGFCWSVVGSEFIKCRLNNKSVFDVQSMSLFSQCHLISDKFLVCIIF